jgi:hypothetical protein
MQTYTPDAGRGHIMGGSNHGHIHLQAPLSNMMSNITNIEHNVHTDHGTPAKNRPKSRQDPPHQERNAPGSVQDNSRQSTPRGSCYDDNENMRNTRLSAQDTLQNSTWRPNSSSHDKEPAARYSMNSMTDPALIPNTQSNRFQQANSNPDHYYGRGTANHANSNMHRGGSERDDGGQSISTTPVNAHSEHVPSYRKQSDYNNNKQSEYYKPSEYIIKQSDYNRQNESKNSQHAVSSHATA